MTQHNGNGTPATSATSNTAAHGATGTVGALAGGYLVARRGWDPAGAMLAVGLASGVIGRIGTWANERKAAGSKNLLVALLANWG